MFVRNGEIFATWTRTNCAIANAEAAGCVKMRTGSKVARCTIAE
jgi:hypothetical protein